MVRLSSTLAAYDAILNSLQTCGCHLFTEQALFVFIHFIQKLI